MRVGELNREAEHRVRVGELNREAEHGVRVGAGVEL